jgi:hypothetical protein
LPESLPFSLSNSINSLSADTKAISIPEKKADKSKEIKINEIEGLAIMKCLDINSFSSLFDRHILNTKRR